MKKIKNLMRILFLSRDNIRTIRQFFLMLTAGAFFAACLVDRPEAASRAVELAWISFAGLILFVLVTHEDPKEEEGEKR